MLPLPMKSNGKSRVRKIARELGPPTLLVPVAAADIDSAMANSRSWDGDGITSEDALNPRQLWRLAEFKRRLAHIDTSYRLWSEFFDSRPSINQSLALLERSLRGPPPRHHRERVRLHPEVEIVIFEFAARRIRRSGGIDAHAEPEPSDIAAACEELLEKLKPIRGRPDNRVLRHHVQALMQLCEWASGKEVTAFKSSNGIYKPRMTSEGGRLIEHFFRGIDLSITTTSLVNIVIETRTKGEFKGKRFEEFFPLYQAEPPPGIGLRRGQPRVRVELTGISHPIYCC